MLVHTLLAIQSAIARKTFDSTDQPLVQFISMIAMNTYILVLNRLLLFN
jgi:hypothetical protein